MTEVTPLRRPQAVPTDEAWDPGDIVRNATDPGDRSLWFYAPGPTDEEGPPFAWVVLFVEDDGGVGYVGDWVDRSELPERLSLIVRDGQPTARQTAMALEEQNEELRKTLRAQQGYLRAFQRRLDDFAENLLDANRDIEFTFRRLDPAGGDA